MLAILVTTAVITCMRHDPNGAKSEVYAGYATCPRSQAGKGQSPDSDSVLSDTKACQAFKCFGVDQ